MMGFALSQQFHLEIAIESEYIETIFPRTERLLNKSRVQEALALLNDEGEMDKYRSMMDFLVCTVFTWVKPLCFAYYEGNGRLLKYDLKNQRTINAYDRFMADIVIPNAVERLKEGEERTWKQATAQARALLEGGI